MIGVDTNVLLRVITEDDDPQRAVSEARILAILDGGEEVFVPLVTLAELAWSLKSQYRYPRSSIADALASIAGTDPFVVQSAAAVDRALAWYRAGPADFADYLILSTSLSEGARGVLTFDGNLLKNPLCEAP